MKLSLVVMTPGKQAGKTLEVKLTQFVIGRDPQCHLRPASPMISKRHCAVLQRDGKAFLRDFGSTNGTFVNDEKVTGEVELSNDDRLKVGPLLFTVKMEASAPVNRPTPAPATRSGDKIAKPAASKPAASDKTPPPPTKPQDEDDDIAAMLLSLGDEEGLASGSADADGIPEGSTQMEILVPPGSTPEPAASGTPAKDAKDPKADKNAKGTGNTASAAKSILDQMMRRPRT
jgi:predicted component of type VI protein secretion system